MTQLEEHAAAQQVTRRAVQLVDVDIHPVMLQPDMVRRLPERWGRHLERYGRRAPFVTDLYPRPRNKGMRADSWPEGGVPGSELRAPARAAARRARPGLRDPPVPQRARRRLRAPRVRRGDQPRRQRVDRRGVARPRRAPALVHLGALRPPRARDRGDRALGRRRPLRPGPAAGGGAGAVRLAQVLAGVPGGRRRRPAGRVPHRRLHGPPRRGLAVVLPRGARGLRRRHADAADEPRLRGHVRRDPEPQGRHDRGRRAVGRRAALAAGRGVVAAARRGPRAGPPALGVHPRPRVVRHAADGGARRSAALPADRRAGRPRGPAHVRDRLSALGLRHPGAVDPARAEQGRAREAPRGHGHASSTACRAQRRSPA